MWQLILFVNIDRLKVAHDDHHRDDHHHDHDHHDDDHHDDDHHDDDHHHDGDDDDEFGTQNLEFLTWNFKGDM